MQEKITVSIPKADENEVANLPQGYLGNINKRFEKIDQVLFGVMIAVVLSLVAIIVSVIGLFLDQMRFNNTIYKEYSQKTNSVEITQNLNKELLEEIKELSQQNKTNSQLIKNLLTK